MNYSEINTSEILPGYNHVPLLGWRWQGLQMLRDPMAFFMKSYAQHGLLNTWDVTQRKQINAFGPEYYREVITQPDLFIVDAFREANLPRGSAMERLSFGLMRLNGDKHRLHRQLMQPAFRSQVIHSYLEDIIQLTNEELDTWQWDDTRNIDMDLTRLVTYISMRTMFGLCPKTEGAELQGLMKDLLKYAGSPLALLCRLSIPGTPYANMLKTSNTIEAKVRDIIRERRETPTEMLDVLSILVNAVGDDAESLSESDLISEAYTVLCHESSAAALTWCLFLLSQHPSIHNALVDSIHAQCGDTPPSLDDIRALDLLDHVVKETLRLCPPAGFSLRYASEACTLGGYDCPKDAMIFLSSYVSHRLPEVFSEPLRFKPERWQSIKPSPYEFVGFGAGAHHCIGRHLAMLEMKVILCLLLQRYRLDLVPKQTIDRGMRISFVPKQGLYMQVKRPGYINSAPVSVCGNILESVDLS